MEQKLEIANEKLDFRKRQEDKRREQQQQGEHEQPGRQNIELEKERKEREEREKLEENREEHEEEKKLEEESEKREEHERCEEQERLEKGRKEREEQEKLEKQSKNRTGPEQKMKELLEYKKRIEREFEERKISLEKEFEEKMLVLEMEREELERVEKVNKEREEQEKMEKEKKREEQERLEKRREEHEEKHGVGKPLGSAVLDSRSWENHFPNYASNDREYHTLPGNHKVFPENESEGEQQYSEDGSYTEQQAPTTPDRVMSSEMRDTGDDKRKKSIWSRITKASRHWFHRRSCRAQMRGRESCGNLPLPTILSDDEDEDKKKTRKEKKGKYFEKWICSSKEDKESPGHLHYFEHRTHQETQMRGSKSCGNPSLPTILSDDEDEDKKKRKKEKKEKTLEKWNGSSEKVGESPGHFLHVEHRTHQETQRTYSNFERVVIPDGPAEQQQDRNSTAGNDETQSGDNPLTFPDEPNSNREEFDFVTKKNRKDVERKSTKNKQRPKLMTNEEKAKLKSKWEKKQVSVKHRDKLQKLLEVETETKILGPLRVCFSSGFVIGQGCHGTCVYVGFYKDGSEVAVKRLVTHASAGTKFMPNEREISALLETEHSEHIVNYRKFHKAQQFSYVVLDLCEETLADYVESHDMEHLTFHGPRIIREILTGLQVLHCEQTVVLHMDLKPENILVDVEGHMRLGDFGISRKVNKAATTIFTDHNKGTQSWRPREMIKTEDQRRSFSRKSDIQVVGMISFYVLTKGKHLYGDDVTFREYNVVKGNAKNLHLLTDPLAREFVSWLISHNKKDRPSAEEALRHKFLKQPSSP